MIRLGDWKLIYYHGLEPQLFNLAEDPGERVDRAQDTSGDCQTMRAELTARLLDGLGPGERRREDGGQARRQRAAARLGAPDESARSVSLESAAGDEFPRHIRLRITHEGFGDSRLYNAPPCLG